jgi:hypothetical protein
MGFGAYQSYLFGLRSGRELSIQGGQRQSFTRRRM